MDASHELREEIEGREWYHTLELAPGLVTPGWWDTRGTPARLPFPSSLSGKRCLDVGTFDGFWAFEMERRGAAEVAAIDILDPLGWDWPVGADREVVDALAARKRGGDGFEVACRALRSRVERRALSVYDLDPQEVGTFEFIFFGSLIIHLRDPVRALERVRDVCAGELLLVDAYHPLLSRLFPTTPLARLDGVGRPWWWATNIACIVQMLRAAGFEPAEAPRRLRVPAGNGQPGPPLSPATLVRREGRERLRDARLGGAAVAILAQPRPLS